MSVDTAVLAMLRAVPSLNVHDGSVEVNETTKVISVPMPYAVFFGKATFPVDPRFSGPTASRGNTVSVTGVGLTREQADLVADRVEKALDRKRTEGRLIRLEDRRLPYRDDEYTRPGGGPIFSVALRFTV